MTEPRFILRRRVPRINPSILAPGPAPTSRGNSGNRPLSERAVTMRCRETCRYVSRRHARKSQDADFLQHPKIHGVGTHPAVLLAGEYNLDPDGTTRSRGSETSRNGRRLFWALRC